MVDDTDVTFKRKDNPDGPEYIEPKKNIVMITYANGTHEIISTGKAFDPIAENFKRNFIALTITDLAALTITLSYEHILKNGKLGFKIPFTINMKPKEGQAYLGNDVSDLISPGRRSFGTGLDINYYPTGQGKAKYFVGPSFQVSSFKYDEYTYWDSYQSDRYVYTGYHYALLINNGMLIQPTKNFNLSFFFGVGVGHNDVRQIRDEYVGRVSTGFMIGFKL